MSMLVSIVRLSPAQIDAIRRDPDCVGDLLDLDPPSSPDESKPGFFSRIFLARRSGAGARKPSRQRTRVLEPVSQSLRYDVDKHWHILHYLFTGTAWEGTHPRAFLASGGSPIGCDRGYGPPRLFVPDELLEISTFLETLTMEVFASGYSLESIKAEALYYGQPGASAEERSAELNALWEGVGEIRQFVAGAAKQGDGILVEIY